MTREERWILCSKRMPEEHEWIGTKEFGTTISDEVFDQNKIDTFYKGSVPIAWMPLPKPYKAESEE